MLAGNSVGLVVDSNIIVDLALPSTSLPLSQILHNWLARLIGEMDVPARGRTVTLFISTRIVADYTTGLGHVGHSAAKTLKLHFKRKFARSATLDTPGRNRFLVKKIDPDLRGAHPPKTGDKYDQAYLDVVSYMMDNGLWRDRAIIVASKDEGLLDSLRGEAARGTVQRFHIACDLRTLEELIRC